MNAPWPKRPKAESLPVLRTDLGFCQRCDYNQPDLYHEEVVEVDGPFDLVAPSGTVCTRTLLLLGDQNAGKTTFLHCFAHQEDDAFTLLTSRLPVLQASFLNSRFLPQGAPMDELPFLDTDVARSTVLLSMDDWNFVLEEQGLPPEASRCAHMCLQLVELGGDHLDRMMRPESVADEALRRVVQQTQSLLRRCHRAAYVLNGATCGSLEQARQRFDFVRRQNPAMELAVFLSRQRDEQQLKEVGSQLRLPVYPFRVLDPATGSLSVEGIVETLTRLVRLDGFAPGGEAEMAAEQLLAAWDEMRSCAAATPPPLWLTARALHEHFADGHGHRRDPANAAPLSHVLGHFAAAAELLARKRMAVLRFGALTSRFAIEFVLLGGGTRRVWLPEPLRDGEVACRFAVSRGLHESLAADAGKVPAGLWGPLLVPDAVSAELVERIAVAFDCGNAELFLLLLDEWRLATASKSAHFPRQLQWRPSSLAEQLGNPLQQVPDNVDSVRIDVA